MRTLRLLLVLLVVFGFSANVSGKKWYITPEGGDVMTGASWGFAFDKYHFFDIYPKGTAEDTFQLSSSIYRMVKEDGSPEEQTFHSSLFGGYLLKSTVQRDLSDENLSVLSGSISPKQEECVPLYVQAIKGDIVTVEGIALESANPDLVASLSTDGSGAEISFKKGSIRRAAPLECPKEPYLTVLNDTLYLGDPDRSVLAFKEVEGSSFSATKVGPFVKDFDLKTKDGCDSIVRHNIIVLPLANKTVEPGKYHYYVKQNGTGNGSSWKNAMSDTAFAYAFGRVEEGATFHLAEGEYEPIYDGPNKGVLGVHSSKTFYSSRAISLIGGYSDKEVNENAVPDPSYRTIIKGKPEDDGVSDVYPRFLLYYSCSSNATGVVDVECVEFENNSNFNGLTSAVCLQSYDNVYFQFDKCKFNQTYGGVQLNGTSGKFTNCQFDITQFNSLAFNGSSKSNVEINSCYSSQQITIDNYDCQIVNSTISSVISNAGNKRLDLRFSTIGELSIEDSKTYDLLGNIIYGKMNVGDAANLTSRNNIYPHDSYENIMELVDKSDYVFTSADMRYFMDNDGENFIAANNGGYTKTIKLISDVALKNNSLRFVPDEASSVSVDQRGMNRPDSTCMGAYEFGFPYHVITLKDSAIALDICKINYPESETEKAKYNFEFDLHDVKMNTADGFHRLAIGDEYEWRDTIKHNSFSEYDTIFVKKFTILPKAEVIDGTLHYFVKVSGSGNGDGSSWENAMSRASFEFAFDTVPDGSTFHFSAGVYSPEKKIMELGMETPIFISRRSLNLIGGYDENPEENAVPNPGENGHQTIFVGDKYCTMRFVPTKDAEISIFGIDFTVGAVITKNGLGCPLRLENSDHKANLTLSKCTFTGSVYSVFFDNADLNVNDCYFYDNHFDVSSVFYSTGKCNLNVSSSTFSHNTYLYSTTCESEKWTNCTFVSNGWSDNSIGSRFNGDIMLLNNTFFDSVWLSSKEKSVIIGNVFSKYLTVDGGDNVDCEYNIIYSFNCSDCDTDPVREETKNLIITDDYSKYFKCDETGPVLSYNGGYTKTIEMVSDRWNNHQLRVPQTLTGVGVDQRGVKRFSNACIGAYEMADYLKDSILLDTTIYKNNPIDTHDGSIAYAKIGYSEWKDTITNEDGSEIALYRKVTVLPQSDGKLNYYVKQDGAGTGDGSSWTDAMSDSAFAFAFGRVEEGATFHVAAGTYHPVYNEQGKQSMLLDGMSENAFCSDKVMNIIGGYPANAKDGDISDVMLNPTMLDGKITENGENKWSRNVIWYKPKQPGDILVSNLIITGNTSRYEKPNFAALNVEPSTRGVSFKMNNVRINSNAYYGLRIDSCETNISNCDFIGTAHAVVKGAADDTIFMSNSHMESLLDLTVGYYEMTNNTFASSVIVNDNLLNRCVGKLVHNTIMGINFKANSECELRNNIVESLYQQGSGLATKLTCINNVVSRSEDDQFVTSNDIVVKSTDFASLLDDEAKYNRKSFTKTIALLKDTVLGTSIRFSRNDNILTDQTGRKRFSQTCPGAYEFESYLKDSIMADTSICKNNPIATHDGSIVYGKIGYNEWKDTITHVDGSVTALYRKVTVLPQSDGKLNYYVKQNGAGTGDGSSWTNAMSDSAFAFAFGRVEEGATFHVAEGTYRPVYDKDGLANEKTFENLTYKEFFSKKTVNIIGGYPESVNDNEDVARDVDVYRTIFEGRMILDDVERYGKNVVHITPDNAGNVHIEDVIISGNHAYHSTRDCGALHLAAVGENVSFTLQNVRFEDDFDYALVADSGTVKLLDCDVEKGNVLLVGADEDSLLVSNSSFMSPVAITTGHFNLVNNTFVKELTFGNSSHSQGSLINNTLANSLYFGAGCSCDVVGNIIYSVTRQGTASVTPLSCSNNVVLSVTDIEEIESSSDNHLVSKESWVYLLDGEAKYNDGAFSKSIALLHDELPDQMSIRFSRVSEVKLDQVGKRRYDFTCPGAYELPGLVITDTLPDVLSIAVGETLGEVQFPTIGPAQYVSDSLLEDGSKMVIVQNVSVLPKSDDQLNYFVKQHGAGKKDGSSWSNAMSDSSFAYAFGKLPAGSVFHVAEGVYYPYDIEDDDNLLMSKGFRSDRGVSIKACYPASSQDGDPLCDVENCSHSTLAYFPSCMEYHGESYCTAPLFDLSSANSKVLLHGIRFSDTISSREHGFLSLALPNNMNDKVSLVKCKFDALKGVTITTSSYTFLNECNFDLKGRPVNIKSIRSSSVTQKLYVQSSSFDCDVVIDGIDYDLVNNSVSRLTLLGGTATLTHNTIDHVIVDNCGTVNVSNSLITFFDVHEESSNALFTSSGNRYREFHEYKNFVVSKSDWVLGDDYQTILLEKDGDYLLTLSPDAFTKTFTLLSDTLPDGKSIRVNRIGVAVDQLKAPRYDSTCPGSLEMKGYTTSADSSKTLYVNESFKGIVFTKIGSETLLDTVNGDYGSKIIVKWSLTILPKSGKGGNGYYVTTDGTGDGSSWANAMDAASFAYSFGRVGDGAIFYVATGDYQPLYDRELRETQSVSALFYTSHAVSVEGGYVKVTEDTYRNDQFANERTTFTRNGADNDSAASDELPIFSFQPSASGSVMLSKVALYGKVSLTAESSADLHYTVDHSVVRFGGVESAVVSSLTVNSTSFDDCKYGIKMSQSADLSVVNSTFGMSANGGAIYLSKDFSGECILEKNSILAPVEIASGSYNFTGNIFAGGVVSSVDVSLKSSHNLYPSTSSALASSDDLISDDVFSLWNDSKLDYDSAYSAVLPLVEEALDGQSIRYLNGSGVKVDQMGHARQSMTCMGSYELKGDCKVSIPTLFDPLGDGGDLFMPGYELYIYDRYGRLLYGSAGQRDGWDGKVGDEYANAGVYVYALYDYCGNLYRGTIEILNQSK